jgi:hypothetical protein
MSQVSNIKGSLIAANPAKNKKYHWQTIAMKCDIFKKFATRRFLISNGRFVFLENGKWIGKEAPRISKIEPNDEFSTWVCAAAESRTRGCLTPV